MQWTLMHDGADEGPVEAAASFVDQAHSLESEALNKPASRPMAEEDVLSASISTRAGVVEILTDAKFRDASSMVAGLSMSEGGSGELTITPNQMLSEKALEARIFKLFVHDGIGPVSSGEPVCTSAVTVEFCAHAKPAAQRMKEQHKGSICMSPVRPDLPLDEMQMLGYLAADVYGRPLVDEEEARPIGKLIHNRWMEEKASKARAGATAKDARKAARKAADSEEQLAAVAAKVAAAEAARRSKVCDIKLPACNTVVVEASPHPIKQSKQTGPAAAAAADELALARAALSTAQAAHVQAEIDLKRAKRALAKLQPPSFSGAREFDWLNATDEKFYAHSAAAQHLVESESNFEMKTLLLRHAEKEVTFELEMAEADKTAESTAVQQAHELILQQLLGQQHTMQLAVAAAAAERASKPPGEETQSIDTRSNPSSWRRNVAPSAGGNPQSPSGPSME